MSRATRDSGLGARLAAWSGRAAAGGAASARGDGPRACAFRASRVPGAASRQSGFTLLEVIAAILLLAIAFASLMRVAGSALDLSQRSAERSRAQMWARSFLDSAFALEPVKAGHSSGRFDQRYAWQLDVHPWQPPLPPGAGPVPQGAPQPALQLYRLDLTVSWQGGGHRHDAHFATLRAAANRGDGR